MIDIENQVFDCIATELRTQISNINVTSEYQNAPSQFPCVSIIQEDSFTDTTTIDSGSFENHVNVMYEINVYSNSKTKKKSECKQIISIVNDKMIELGFARTMLNAIPNIDDSFYRIVARYTGKVDSQYNIFRR